MAGTRAPRKRKTPRHARREPKLGRIEFNPSPDAEDRLRRLFTILASHFAEKDAVSMGKDCPSGIMPAGSGCEAAE